MYRYANSDNGKHASVSRNKRQKIDNNYSTEQNLSKTTGIS